MKLICIDDETDILKFGDGVKELTYGKEYEIISFYEKTHDGRQFIKLINDKGRSNDYLIDRFVSLERFREIQLNKIGI
jgi:hypothetical protein